MNQNETINEAIKKISEVDCDQAAYLGRVLQRTSTPAPSYWYCRGLIDGYRSRGTIDNQEHQLIHEALDSLLWGNQ